MESKLYKDLISLSYTIFSNDELLAKITSDEKFKENVILNINGIMFLEKNHSTNLDDVQYGKSIARALVKLLNEKIAFSISSLTIDKIEEEMIFFSTTISNTFGFSKDAIFDEKKSISNTDFIEFVKVYREQSKPGHEATTIQDDSTIQINTIDAGAAENIQVNNSNRNNGGPQPQQGQPQFNQQNMGQLFQNPMNSERFYPFKTKPKEMRWIKFVFAGAISLIGIMFIVIYAILGSQVIIINSDNAKIFSGTTNTGDFNQHLNNIALMNKYIEIFDREFKMSPFTIITQALNLSTGVEPFSIILNVITILIIFSMVYPMMKPPRVYRDQYRVNGSTLFLFGFLIVVFAFPLMLNSSGGMTQMIFHLGFKDYDPNAIADNYLKFLFSEEYLKTADKEQFINLISSEFNLMTLRVLSIITITFMFIFLAMYFAIFFINPKVDREKYRRFMIEMQKKSMAALQGKSYQIDPSLFESDEEMEAWNKKKGKSNN
ncbi:hypothetical protein [Spiroplasma endosymbiont of Othius punctulatus]|uniref:hypothetical protein n=1 Tax=Spiroplasma endosymbiont of Othius punctulatus TaxID=3066289 RepID=UPI0030D338A8